MEADRDMILDTAQPPVCNRSVANSRSVIALLVLGYGIAVNVVTADAATKPNIIVIYTDDQGFGDVSCLNPNSKFQTPNMDRLASEGISFTNGHSADTVCTPSRYALLTGRYCWRTSQKTGVMGAEGTCLITDGRMTLASLLRDNGYDTAMIGKWHLGMDFPGDNHTNRDWSQPVLDMPLDKGFDYFFGVPASLNYGVLAWFEGRYAKTPPTVFTNKKPNERHVDYRIMPPYQDSPEAAHQALGTKGMEVAPDFIDNQCLTRFTDQAIQWMRMKTDSAKREKPFFVYLPYTSPHYPVCPLPEFFGKGNAGGYGEFVIETDFHLGRILDFLKTSGLDDNTLIVFSSDNGPESSWKHRIEQFDHDSSGIYKGGKRDIEEGGHRVPFFARWPAGISQPGRISDSLVGQVDLIATFAEIIGAELPENAGEDSQSFAKIFFEPNSNHERLPLVNHSNNGRFAITQGAWKLVLPHKNFQRELYDLVRDPGEENNIVDLHPKIAASLETQITEIVIRGRTTLGATQPNDTGHWPDLTWIRAAEYPSQDSR